MEIILRRSPEKVKVVAQRTYPGSNPQMHGARLNVYLEESAATPENVPWSYELDSLLAGIKIWQSFMKWYLASGRMREKIAKGKSLEVIAEEFHKVYGIDINRNYLAAVEERYSDISDILECIQLNLIEDGDRLPMAELLVANLIVEYIGYDRFQEAIEQVQPKYVSCIIQINVDDSWVSDSPYIHAFDELDKVHHQLVQLDFIKKEKFR